MTPEAPKPLLVVADDDVDERALVVAELERRYRDDYDVAACALDDAESVLRRAKEDGLDVAVNLG